MAVQRKQGKPEWSDREEYLCYFVVDRFLPNLVSAERLAKLLGVRTRTVERWRVEQGLQSFKVAGGRAFYLVHVREWARDKNHTAFVSLLDQAIVPFEYTR